MRGPLMRSTSSDIARNVGSSSRPAASARAAAASVSSAAARNSGLRRRLSARTLSTVAPGSPASCAGAGPLAAIAAAKLSARAPRYGDTAISLRQLDGDGAAHRLGFALYLGAEGQAPLARHSRQYLELIDARRLRGQCLDRGGHFRHAGRPHIGLRLDNDRARHRLAVGYVNEAQRDDRLTGCRWLRFADSLKAIVRRGGFCLRKSCNGSQCE